MLNILKYRQEKKMSQIVLAKELGITTAAVSQYENGKREPSIQTLQKIAKVFSCTVDDLINDTNRNKRSS